MPSVASTFVPFWSAASLATNSFVPPITAACIGPIEPLSSISRPTWRVSFFGFAIRLSFRWIGESDGAERS